MAIEFDKGEAPAPRGLVADRRLWLTSDGAHVVEDGSPDAAFLLAAPESLIPAAECVRLGLSLADGKVVQAAEAGADEVPPPPEE